jgi:hypothetical protein
MKSRNPVLKLPVSPHSWVYTNCWRPGTSKEDSQYSKTWSNNCSNHLDIIIYLFANNQWSWIEHTPISINASVRASSVWGTCRFISSPSKSALYGLQTDSLNRSVRHGITLACIKIPKQPSAQGVHLFIKHYDVLLLRNLEGPWVCLYGKCDNLYELLTSIQINK